MISDLRILATREALLLDVPTVARTTVAARFEQFIITEDVVVEDVTARVARLGVHGPRRGRGRRPRRSTCRSPACTALAEHAHVDVEFQDAPVVRRRLPRPRRAGLRHLLRRRARHRRRGAPVRGRRATTSPPTPGTRCGSKPACRCSASTWTPTRSRSKPGLEDQRDQPDQGLLRRPGSDHPHPAPRRRARRAPAGRVDRGRRVDAATRSCRRPGRAIAVDGKDIGRVTSAAWSPALRRLIGLGYAHRDHTEPGTKLTVGVDPPVAATVATLPLVAMPTAPLPPARDSRSIRRRRRRGDRRARRPLADGPPPEGHAPRRAVGVPGRQGRSRRDARSVPGARAGRGARRRRPRRRACAGRPTHDYPAKRVELHFYDCTIDGEPRPLLGQELRWVSASELASLPLPEADAGLVALLTRR